MIVVIAFHVFCQVFHGFSLVQFLGKRFDIRETIGRKVAAVFCRKKRQDVCPADVKILLIGFYIHIHGVPQRLIGHVEVHPFDIVVSFAVRTDRKEIGTVFCDKYAQKSAQQEDRKNFFTISQILSTQYI